MVILRSQNQITDFFMILDLGMSLYSWPTIYDAGPALNEHSASSTQSPDFMRLSLRVRLRVRLRRVHKAVLPCNIFIFLLASYPIGCG